MDTTMSLVVLKKIIATTTRGFGGFLLVLGLAMPVWGQDAEDCDVPEKIGTGGNLILGCEAAADVAADNGYLDDLKAAQAAADAAKVAADKVETDAETATAEARAVPAGADAAGRMAHTASLVLADAVSKDGAGTAVTLATRRVELGDAEMDLATAEMELATAETAKMTADDAKTAADMAKTAADAAKTAADDG